MLIQVEFQGLSGRIAFDSLGLRRDYHLDILEVNLNRGLAKVTNIASLNHLHR